MVTDCYSQRRLMMLKGKMPQFGLTLNIGSSENVEIIPTQCKVVNLDIAHFQMHNFVMGSAEHLPFRSGIFDNVLLFDVLEHVANDSGVVSESRMVLKSDGRLYAAIPCREDDFFMIEFPSFLKKVDWPEMERRWGHVRRGYTRQEVRNLFGKHFEVVHMERGIANFGRIGLQLYFLREWDKSWGKSRLVRGILSIFNHLDRIFCCNKGHLIFAIFHPRPVEGGE